MDSWQSSNLTESIMAVARRVRRSHMSALKPLGLNPSQSRAMHVLARAEESVRLRDLADHLRIGPRSATEVVDSLESANLVSRRADPTDRRAVLVDLTETGRGVLDRINDARRHVSADLFDVLEPAERAELNRLMSKIMDG